MFSFLRQQKESKESWYTHAVVYQIYPRSFQDSNGDGVGDIRGIIQRIPYLSSLGVQAVWISPMYTSPMKDGGYDIADFYNIDPTFGTLADFDELVARLHEHNIKLITDLVINHTSSMHPWFIEARSSRTNPKRNWYVWRDGKTDGAPPNNWLSVSGGSAWTKDDMTGQYYLHHFLKEQPDLNWRNEEVRDEIERIAEFWMKRGVDGFRVDALSHFVEDGLFRDDPTNAAFIAEKSNPYDTFVHTFSTNRPQLKEVISLLCNTIQRFQEKFMVFETYLGLGDMLSVYNMHPDEHHAPFNFNLMSLPWRASAFKHFIDTFDTSLSSKQVPTYVLGNHDRTRLAQYFGTEKARLCAMLLLTLRGMTFIYYGEEIGMTDVEIPQDKIQDIFSKQSNNTHSTRDSVRTPMQWNGHIYAGFSTHEPWLPLAKNYKEVNVDSQLQDQHSILALYKKLLAFRKTNEAMHRGTYESVATQDEHVFVYIRSHNKKRVCIVLNFSQTSTEITLPSAGTLVCNTELDIKENTPTSAHISLRPFEGKIILLNQ